MMARLHRPYARKRGGPPSVTTVLGCLDKPGLPWGAANETANFAVHHRNLWLDLDPDEAYERLRRYHRGLWDGRAAMGTLVHEVNECWTHGEEVDLGTMVDAVKDLGRIWKDQLAADIVEEAGRYVDGLERFWVDFSPDTIAAEDVVRHNDRINSYIGQRDWRARINGHRYLLDIKTTGKQEADKGLYPDTWRLQLAAYRHAEEVVEYDDDANEIGTHPNEPVDRCGIVHLRGDGDYTLYEVPAAGTEYNRFLQLRGIYEWLKGCKKDPGLEPVYPTPAEEPADTTRGTAA